MTSPSPSSITGKEISDREIGVTSVVHSEQELGDVFAMTLSCEMDVLYDPLNNFNSESRTRVIPQNEANTLYTEYDLSSLMLRFFSIVAVHGLGSTPNRAWTHKESRKNWLKDFLPDDLNHKARIMTYNHQSQWESYAFLKSFDGFAQDLLRIRGTTMLEGGM